MKAFVAVAMLLTVTSARAADFTPRVVNLQLSAGQNPMNQRGQSSFRTVSFEVVGDWPRITRLLPDTEVGASLSYSKIRQARSWFGYTYGDPDDRVRAETLFVFARHHRRNGARVRPYIEIGTGPMWSNRRVPAATSRINFSSQGGFGVELMSQSKRPYVLGYRFAHISNGGTASRNPGLNVHTFLIGTRLMRWPRK